MVANNHKRGFSLIQWRQITTESAKSLLGLEHDTFTVRELRQAYFEAAKLHHPDAVKHTRIDTLNGKIPDFIEITVAYEHLLQSSQSTDNHDSSTNIHNIIDHDEETEYRTACLDILGIPAEIVEESKKNPMFRQWLMGKTDAAMHWKMFLSKYGGLAEKIRPRVQVAEGKKAAVRKVDTRRKRR